MRLYEFAERIRQQRLKTVDNPRAGGFVQQNDQKKHWFPWHKEDSVWAMVMEVELHYKINGVIRPVCITPLFYVDTDPNAKSPEAQLIRAGIWNPYDCGWLLASIKGNTVMLAKVTPSEKTDLDDGWMTNSGQLVLKRE